MLAPVGVVGEIEDVLPRGGEVGADGDPRCLGDSLASAVFSHHTRLQHIPLPGTGEHETSHSGYRSCVRGSRMHPELRKILPKSGTSFSIARREPE